MGYIFLMSIAGSALFVGYLCWEKILGKSMTQCLKYKALMIVMLVYVMPWEWLKGAYRYVMSLFFPEQVDVSAKGLVDIADIKVKEIAYQTKEYQWMMLAVPVWLTIAAMLLLIHIAKYMTRRHELHRLAIECGDENLEQTLQHLQKTIRYKRKLVVAWTRVNNETFTLGAIKPVIYLQKEYVEGDLYWILKHEITHIVRMDLLVKLLMEFVCCLHWFNPLIYYLERKIKYLCETSCDERVIQGCTEEECQIYMNLLDRNKDGNGLKISFENVPKKGSMEIDKRIKEMRERKNIRRGERAIVTCVFAFLVFLDSLTALAYPDIHHVKSDAIRVAEDSIDGGNFWVYKYAEEGYDIPIEDILYDVQFVDSAGGIYPMESMRKDSSCLEHKVVSGIVQIHIKNEDGSCRIEIYEGTRCQKCGVGWKGEFLYKFEMLCCPHELLSEE